MDIVFGLVAIGIALWLSLTILKFLFIGAKRALGWAGPYIASIVPSAGVYVAGKLLLGVGTYNSTLQGIVTMIVVGRGTI